MSCGGVGPSSLVRLRISPAMLGLACIIAVSAALSLYWVFTVPIFQSPDEHSHFDYAINIYSAGRPITVREPIREWHANSDGEHLYTEYLANEAGLYAMQFHPTVKAPSGYGSRDFYRRLDANAPAESSGQFKGASRTNYNLITIYPAGYYTALALWMKLISVFSAGVTALFFGARIFSVLLLVL